MRRLWVVSALAVLVFAGGCTSGGTSNGGSSNGGSSNSGGGRTPSVDVSANTAQVCADSKKVINDSTQKFAQALAQAVQAATTGKPDAQNQALETIRTLFKDWSAGLRTQAGKALNPELKSTLTDFANALDALVAQVKTADDLSKVAGMNTPELQAAQDKFGKICGD
jgi:hypothetical protein